MTATTWDELVKELREVDRLTAGSWSIVQQIQEKARAWTAANRGAVVEMILDHIDEVATLIEFLPDEDPLKAHLVELEGQSNGGWPYSGDENQPDFMRDAIAKELHKEIQR